MLGISNTKRKLLSGLSTIFGNHLIGDGIDKLSIRSRSLVCLRGRECARFAKLWQLKLITTAIIDAEPQAAQRTSQIKPVKPFHGNPCLNILKFVSTPHPTTPWLHRARKAILSNDTEHHKVSPLNLDGKPSLILTERLAHAASDGEDGVVLG
jgi:hypothetical protein